MAKKAEVDKSLCIGCGSCVSSCGAYFEMGEDGKAQTKDGGDDRCCDLNTVADNCSVQAISVTEK